MPQCSADHDEVKTSDMVQWVPSPSVPPKARSKTAPGWDAASELELTNSLYVSSRREVAMDSAACVFCKRVMAFVWILDS